MIKVKNIGEIDLDRDIELSVSNNGKLIYLNRVNPILAITPPLYCENGLIENKSKYSNYELEISLKSTTKDNNKLCEYFFESIDQKLIQLGKENKHNWAFTERNKILYKSIFGDNGNLRFKIINSKEFNTIVCDVNGHIISVHDYKSQLSGSFYVQLVIELVCIWIKNNKYELYVRLHEIKIIKRDNIPEYILSDSSES